MDKISSWEQFEETTVELLSAKYNTSFTLYGRRGECQDGIDAYSIDGKILAQCKYYNNNNSRIVGKFIKSIEKDYNSALHAFQTAHLYIIATSLPRSTKVQKAVLKIQTTVLPISVLFQEDIRKLMDERRYLELKEKKNNKGYDNSIDGFSFYSLSSKLVGRSEQMKELFSFLEDTKESVLWWGLVGQGGTGKSRLVYEIGCSIEGLRWFFIHCTRDNGLSVSDIKKSVEEDNRNCFIAIDNDLSNLENVAKFLCYLSSQRLNKKVRILISQRTPLYLTANELAPWYKSMIDFNESISKLMYKKPLLCLPRLDDSSLSEIARSYITNIYPQKICSKTANELILSKLKQVDPVEHRPLYLLFIADAYANGKLEDAQNEDELLDYVFKRERRIIRNRIEEAFGVDYPHNPELFDRIEIDYVRAIIRGSESQQMEILNHSKLCNTSESNFYRMCDFFGITVNRAY